MENYVTGTPNRETASDNKNNAIRMTFSYEGDSVKLISLQKLKKLLPKASVTAETQQTPSRIWYELTDSTSNRLIQRQNLNYLIKGDLEVFSDDPNNPISRHDLTSIKGTFSIVLPDITDAVNFELFAASTARGRIMKKRIFHFYMEGR